MPSTVSCPPPPTQCGCAPSFPPLPTKPVSSQPSEELMQRKRAFLTAPWEHLHTLRLLSLPLRRCCEVHAMYY